LSTEKTAFLSEFRRFKSPCGAMYYGVYLGKKGVFAVGHRKLRFSCQNSRFSLGTTFAIYILTTMGQKC